MRQLTMRLAAMDLDNPILGAIAERWLKLTMPAQEGDRAILEAKLGDIRSRIAASTRLDTGGVSSTRSRTWRAGSSCGRT